MQEICASTLSLRVILTTNGEFFPIAEQRPRKDGREGPRRTRAHTPQITATDHTDYTDPHAADNTPQITRNTRIPTPRIARHSSHAADHTDYTDPHATDRTGHTDPHVFQTPQVKQITRNTRIPTPQIARVTRIHTCSKRHRSHGSHCSEAGTINTNHMTHQRCFDWVIAKAVTVAVAVV
jgi:hypothetical protein